MRSTANRNIISLHAEKKIIKTGEKMQQEKKQVKRRLLKNTAIYPLFTTCNFLDKYPYFLRRISSIRTKKVHFSQKKPYTGAE